MADKCHRSHQVCNENGFSYYFTGPIFCFLGVFAFILAKPAKPYLICQGEHPQLSPLCAAALNGQFWDLKIARISQSTACFFAGGLHQTLTRPEPETCSTASPQPATVQLQASIIPLFIAFTIAQKVRVQRLRRQTKLLLALNHNINLLLHITNRSVILLPGYKLQKGALGMLTSNKIALSLTFDPKG